MQEYLNTIIEKSLEYEDGETGIDSCIELYCEEHSIPEKICEAAKKLAFKQGALEAGIPLSVIEGKKKLNEVFSQDYINWKCGKK